MARPRFIVVYQERRIPLPDGEFIVGRGIGCHVRFNAEAVSRQHLRLIVKGGRVLAENLSKTTGTLINGQRLAGQRSLTHGDELVLGPRRFRIEVEDVEDAALADFDHASDHEGSDEVTEMRDHLGGPGRVAELLPTGIDFHTCPKCRAKVAFGDSVCANCGYAWSASHPSAVTGRITLRDMAHEIAPMPAAVPVVYGSEELTIDAVVVDLRADAAFIPSELLDPNGTTCELTLLPDGIFAMKVSAKVVMVRPTPDAKGPAGMEVRFLDVPGVARAWLDRWIATRAS